MERRLFLKSINLIFSCHCTLVLIAALSRCRSQSHHHTHTHNFVAGPHNFTNTSLQSASRVTIHSGTIGRSSHQSFHGNNVSNIAMVNLTMRDFEVNCSHLMISFCQQHVACVFSYCARTPYRFPSIILFASQVCFHSRSGQHMSCVSGLLYRWRQFLSTVGVTSQSQDAPLAPAARMSLLMGCSRQGTSSGSMLRRLCRNVRRPPLCSIAPSTPEHRFSQGLMTL